MKRNIRFFAVCLLASHVFFFGCATGNHGRQRVLTAYMDNGYLKYYIRPEKMESTEYKKDKAFVMIDFSYQKENREYVSDAYVNFTLHYATDAYITKAFFSCNDEVIPLSNIRTLDRSVSEKYIRISTIAQKTDIGRLLDNLKAQKGVLEISLENGETKSFVPTASLVERIEEAFGK